MVRRLSQRPGDGAEMLVHRAYPGINRLILTGDVRSSTQLQRIDGRPSRIRTEILYLEQGSLEHSFHGLRVLPSFLVELMKFVFDPLKQSGRLLRPFLKPIG